MRNTRTNRLKKGSIAIAIGALAALLPLGLNSADAAVALFDFPCSSGGRITGDFNNDTRPDMAFGAPGDDLEQIEVDGSITEGVTDAGSISVAYSGPNSVDGLNPTYRPAATSRLFFSQNTPSVADNAEKDDNFGFAIAAGDFNGSGGDDLAIGIPGENGSSGAVQVLYSQGTSGLAAGDPGSTAFNRLITQNTPGVEGVAESGDLFGYAVASGDFNTDGFDDLAIGAPKEDIGSRKDAGALHIIYGSPTGLNSNGQSSGGAKADQLFEQGPGQIRKPEIGRTEAGDFFGASIVAGQFNDGGPIDIAVGSPGEDIGTKPDAGAVTVMYSRGSSGLSTIDRDFFHQDTKDLDGMAEAGDRFGCSLAAGDFDGDLDDDLAVGVPGEGIVSDARAGAVHVLYNTGRSNGIAVDPKNLGFDLSWNDDQVWTEDEGGIPGISKPDDRFGSSLASGDFDNDGKDDLAIGLATEELYGHKGAGSVRVLYGFNGHGLTDSSPSAFAQSPHDMPSACFLMGITGGCDFTASGPEDYSPLLMIEEENDRVGSALAVADFNLDGRDDLVIGAPGEDPGAFFNWLSEEEAMVPDELLTQFGIPVPLSIDEAVDAGVAHVVYGPFPTPSDAPASQDLIYRQPGGSFASLRSFMHTALGEILENNRIAPPSPATPDSSYSDALSGDYFGASTP